MNRFYETIKETLLNKCVVFVLTYYSCNLVYSEQYSKAANSYFRFLHLMLVLKQKWTSVTVLSSHLCVCVRSRIVQYVDLIEDKKVAQVL